MKTRAVSMVLLMIASALAGCTSGDPDGDGEMGIDTDMLNEMIEDNLQDFINNTSVTVHQEIHYHNNTTVVNNCDETNNEYQNTTNVDGGEVVNNNYDQSETNYNIGGASFGEGVSGSVNGGDMLFVAHIEWTAMDLLPNYEPPASPQNNDFNYTYSYYDYLTNDWRTDNFHFSCGVFYIVGSQSSNNSSQVSYWEDNDNYYNAWEQMYNSTIADLLSEAGQDNYVQNLCGENFVEQPIVSASDGYSHTFLTIDLPIGYAIEYIQYYGEHNYFGCSGVVDPEYAYSCHSQDFGDRTDYNYWNYSAGQSSSNFSTHTSDTDGYFGGLFGGWSNLSIEFSIDLSSYYRTCRDNNGYLYDNNGNQLYCNYDMGSTSMWPSSEYSFTLYYRFVPVIPVD